MSYVEWLFAFLNFGVLATLLGYAFRSKFLPKLIREIQDGKAQRKAFEKQKEEFFEKLALIGQERENREALYHEISGKVMQWKKAESERKTAFDEEKVRALVSLKERVQLQQERAAMQRIKARVVPQALAQARLELYDFFQHYQAGNAYLKDVIKVVDQRAKEQYGRGA